MPETTKMEIVQNKFKDQQRLIVGCYICDEDGKELDSKEYMEKGRTLKIVTEDYIQEVAIGDRRYVGPGVNEIIYRDNGKYHGEDIKFLNEEEEEPTGIRLNTDIDQAMQSLSESSIVFYRHNITPVYNVSFNNKINDYNNPSEIRNDEYKPSMVDNSGSSGDDLSSPDEEELIPDISSPVRFTHIHVVDRYCSHDKFQNDPNTSIDIPDDCRKLTNISEMYTSGAPSIRYNANPVDGLDAIIVQILNNKNLDKYNLEKIIIGEHTSPKLLKFKPKSSYSISKSTYELLFKKFKNVEIANPIIDVIFPSGNLTVENLTLANCNILSNDTTITVESTLKIENCYFGVNDPSGAEKYTIFKVKSDMNVNGITIKGLSNISFINETPEINIDILSLKYDMVYEKKRTNSLIKVLGFRNVSVLGIEIMKQSSIPYLPLIDITNCTTINILNVNTNGKENKSNLLIVKGFDELNVDGIEDVFNSDGTLLNISQTTEEAHINLISVNSKTKKLVNVVKSHIGLLNFNKCTLNPVKLFSLIDTPLYELTVGDSDIKFKEDLNLILEKSIFSNTTLSGIGLELRLNSEIAFNNCIIDFKTMTLNMNKIGKISSRDSVLNIKDVFKIGTLNEESKNSKIDFIKTTIDGGSFSMNDLYEFAISYSIISCREFNLTNLSLFDSVENYLKFNKLKNMNFTNIADLKQSKFFIDVGGDSSLNTDNCHGKLNLDIQSDSKIMRNSINSRTIEKYNCSEGVTLKLPLNSEGCNSSSFLVNKKSLLVSPKCKDFKLFKHITEDFDINSSAKDLYNEIYYGMIE